MLGEGLAFAALLMFSANIILTKVASAKLSLDTGFLVAVSVNVAFAALLFAAELALRPDALQWNLVGFFLFLAAGVCSTYLGRFFFFEAIARLGPARASTFQVTSPLFTAVIAWLFLGERLSATSICAIVLTMLGLLLSAASPFAFARGRRARAVAPDGVVAAPATTPSARARLGVVLRSGLVLGVGSSAAYAMGNVLRGAAVRHWNEVVLGALLGALAALALQLLFSAGNEGRWRRLRDANRAGLKLYATGGVLTIVAQICMIASMRYIPVAIASLITLCTPLLVFPMSYFLLKNEEGIGGRTLVGAALTLVGIGVIVFG
jgi:drug/metabolite transporter (DMT)-like permease